jgi:hypothetical protein
VLTAGLTFALVLNRPGVAGLVLLAVGGGAIFLSLAHARVLLRVQEERNLDALEIPGIAGLGRRIGLEPFTWLQGAPVLEILVLVASLTTVTAVPWGVLVLAAASRLWRWFVVGQNPGFVTSAASEAGRAGGSGA